MATSGSVDFNVTRDELIRASLRVLGQLDFRSDPSLPEYTTASQALNILVKSWQNREIGLWLNSEATLHLDTSSLSYSLSSSGAHCAYTSYRTEVATAASSGASSIVVDSDDNITNGDFIGVELDDGTLQWTTVNGVPSNDTVTLTASLTDDVSVDATVYNYTTKIDRPLGLIEIRSHSKAGNDTPMRIVSRNDYMVLSDKDTAGTPTLAYYDPQLSASKLYLWPVADSIETRIKMTVKRPIEDFDAAANNAEFPVEWLRALKYNLAYELAPEYMLMYHRNPREFPRITHQQLAIIADQAQQSLYEAEQFDTTDASYTMAPDLDGYWYGV